MIKNWFKISLLVIGLIFALTAVYYFVFLSSEHGTPTQLLQSSTSTGDPQGLSSQPIVTDKCTKIGQNYFSGQILGMFSGQHSTTNQDEFLLPEYVYNPQLDTCLISYYHIHNDPLWEHYDEYLIVDSINNKTLLRYYSHASFDGGSSGNNILTTKQVRP